MSQRSCISFSLVAFSSDTFPFVHVCLFLYEEVRGTVGGTFLFSSFFFPFLWLSVLSRPGTCPDGKAEDFQIKIPSKESSGTPSLETFLYLAFADVFGSNRQKGFVLRNNLAPLLIVTVM